MQKSGTQQIVVFGCSCHYCSLGTITPDYLGLLAAESALAFSPLLYCLHLLTVMQKTH